LTILISTNACRKKKSGLQKKTSCVTIISAKIHVIISKIKMRMDNNNILPTKVSIDFFILTGFRKVISPSKHMNQVHQNVCRVINSTRRRLSFASCYTVLFNKLCHMFILLKWAESATID
jgi:hypothetical protein